MTSTVAAALCFVALLSATTALQVTNKSTVPVAAPKQPCSQKVVDSERANLETMATMLTKMLKSDGLTHSKVAPAMRLFTSNLESVLNASKSMEPTEAMQKLKAAKASIAGLVGEMTTQQESLMRDDFEQRESLLMGVLMSKKDLAMDKQFDILRSEDFEGLDVSRELLKAHDTQTALYKQAASYLDAHKHAGGVLSHNTRESRLQAMGAAFDKRVTALVNDAKVRQVRHQQTIAKLTRLARKAKGRDATVLKARVKREEHYYKKLAARSQHDIASMKEAATAFRTGDTKALNHAQAELKKSLDALKNENDGVIVFLQQANTYLEKDCPYCAAQCVEKCHNNGESYVTCLSECAGAGKN
jgi:hypothetical protein